MARGSQAYSMDGMRGITIAILLTIFALVVIPLIIGYYLGWREQFSKGGGPAATGRMHRSRDAAFPWFVVVLIVWWFQR